jgi:hypothetical protein
MSVVKDFAAKVAFLVDELPKDVVDTHGTADDLEQKIIDLVFPLECDDDEPIPESPVSAPKKRGRPKGSKNKVTKDVPVSTEEASTKKRGRPKGSKNKNKKDDVVVEVPTTPKKRGRPKGSQNKNKQVDVDVPTAPKKRVKKKIVFPETPTASSVGRRKGQGDKHTRKSKKSTAAATTIQQWFRAWD